MKVRYSLILIMCFMLLICVTGVNAADTSHMTVKKNCQTLNNDLDNYMYPINNQMNIASEDNNASDIFGNICITVFGPDGSYYEGAEVDLYGWKQGKFEKGATTNHLGTVSFWVEWFSHHHLVVTYKDGHQVKGNINKADDLVYVYYNGTVINWPFS